MQEFAQEELDAVRKQWPELQPMPENPAPGSALTLAAKNIRTIIKTRWPTVKARVSVERFSMGNSINVRFVDLADKDAATQEDLDSVLQAFVHSTYDSMSESTSGVETNREFRFLFGQTKYVHVNPMPPEEAQLFRAEAKARRMNQALPNPVRSSKPRF